MRVIKNCFDWLYFNDRGSYLNVLLCLSIKGSHERKAFICSLQLVYSDFFIQDLVMCPSMHSYIETESKPVERIQKVQNEEQKFIVLFQVQLETWMRLQPQHYATAESLKL